MAHFFDHHIARPIVGRIPSWLKANHLTFLRALLVAPVIVWRDRPVLACGVVILSSLLDLFDGPVARIRNETSRFGALLDMASDKVFLLGALLFACGARVAIEFRVAIVGLDLLTLGMRPLKLRLGATAKSNAWGAAKTWAQSFAIGFVLSRAHALVFLAPAAFSLAVALGVLSLSGHIRDLISGPRKA